MPNNDRLAAARKARSTAKRAKVLGRERLQAVWDDMELTVLPTWLPPAPHHIGDGRHGKLSADQWRTFCSVHLVITLVRLWGPLDETDRLHQLLVNYMDLVAACTMATMRTSSAERIQTFQQHYMRYLDQLGTLFPEHSLSPTQHISAHLVEQMAKFGPTHSTWAFVFERTNHMLQQINTNHLFGKRAPSSASYQLSIRC